jgi:hypothetical protein
VSSMAEVGLLRFARVALEVAKAVLPDYRTKFSKHVFTQPQLLAVVCLMRYEDWALRKAEVRLAEHSDELRSASLGLPKAPETTHHALPFYAAARGANPAGCSERERPPDARLKPCSARTISHRSARRHRLGSGGDQHLLPTAHAKPRW